MTHGKIQPLLVLALALATLGSTAATAREDEAMLGFSPAGVSTQLGLERRFDAQLDPADQRSWLKQMSSEPNQVGSPHDKANAEFMLAKFREWGWDAHIETFNVKTVPGVREAIEARRWNEANHYATVTANVIDRYRAQLDQLTALLNK
jgi:hypothetical protein